MARAPSELVNQIGGDCFALLLAAEMPHWAGIASFPTLPPIQASRKPKSGRHIQLFLTVHRLAAERHEGSKLLTPI